MQIAVYIAALVFPLVLIPVERLFPYPHIVEELIKAILIAVIILHSSQQKQFMITVLMAAFFAISENIFYSTNFMLAGNLTTLYWQRCILTTALHVFTAIIILLPSQKKFSLIVPSTLMAILVHFTYNRLVLFLF